MMASELLSPSSYLVLGLLALDGPATPYQLKQVIGGSIGKFWAVSHTSLYQEPQRLVHKGLVVESRESSSRRRRVFSITDDGRAALDKWFARPATERAEIRDLALLQLFLADLAAPADLLRIATEQIRLHTQRLAEYEETNPASARPVVGDGMREVRRRAWQRQALRMGSLYEEAAVGFWTSVLAMARDGDQAAETASAEDAG